MVVKRNLPFIWTAHVIVLRRDWIAKTSEGERRGAGQGVVNIDFGDIDNVDIEGEVGWLSVRVDCCMSSKHCSAKAGVIGASILTRVVIIWCASQGIRFVILWSWIAFVSLIRSEIMVLML